MNMMRLRIDGGEIQVIVTEGSQTECSLEKTNKKTHLVVSERYPLVNFSFNLLFFMITFSFYT